MTAYVILSAVVTWLLAWFWFSYLFPKAREELSGSPTEGRGKVAVLSALALLILAAAVGTFIQNRDVLGTADTLRLGLKIWFGFLLPILLVFWASVRKSVSALVAVAGYWFLTAVIQALLADWMLLR